MKLPACAWFCFVCERGHRFRTGTPRLLRSTDSRTGYRYIQLRVWNIVFRTIHKEHNVFQWVPYQFTDCWAIADRHWKMKHFKLRKGAMTRSRSGEHNMPSGCRLLDPAYSLYRRRREVIIFGPPGHAEVHSHFNKQRWKNEHIRLYLEFRLFI